MIASNKLGNYYTIPYCTKQILSSAPNSSLNIAHFWAKLRNPFPHSALAPVEVLLLKWLSPVGSPSRPDSSVMDPGTSHHSWWRHFCFFSGTIHLVYLPSLPSGERLHFAMERSTIFHGKIHYFYGHFPLQNVSSPGRVSLGCFLLLFSFVVASST